MAGGTVNRCLQTKIVLVIPRHLVQRAGGAEHNLRRTPHPGCNQHSSLRANHHVRVLRHQEALLDGIVSAHIPYAGVLGNQLSTNLVAGGVHHGVLVTLKYPVRHIEPVVKHLLTRAACDGDNHHKILLVTFLPPLTPSQLCFVVVEFVEFEVLWNRDLGPLKHCVDESRLSEKLLSLWDGERELFLPPLRYARYFERSIKVENPIWLDRFFDRFPPFREDGFPLTLGKGFIAKDADPFESWIVMDQLEALDVGFQVDFIALEQIWEKRDRIEPVSESSVRNEEKLGLRPDI